MPVNIKELSGKEDRLTGGHRLCAGCGASIAVRQILLAIDKPVVVANATGCLEVATTIYPYTAWKTPWIHSAFENAAATISGVEAAYQSLKRQGKITDDDIAFLAFGGDGGTYDIGFQSLSGAMERNHNILYICYDNEAYMNTGIQRSSATPLGAWTTTTPVGKVRPGKVGGKKDIVASIAEQGAMYVAQASISNFRDLIEKVRKAVSIDGATFINVLSPCPRGWRTDTSDTVNIARLAVDTCYWPLYEVENGKWKINYTPRQKLPVTEYLKPQGRFAHLFRPENQHILEEIQEWVDSKWDLLQKKAQLFQ
ncbi:MAG: pyruvate ferredoxin oxidoreductase [Dictyoglomi bacterium]|jgi:pyruvate ferredoxin oxidoreductase beta subunit|nr:pyruvate ferredoxin oxidoreductase [Dictyoglomota bacterium]HHV80298.1 pyruvate ferredoxin oxidoreductase [bacterium]